MSGKLKKYINELRIQRNLLVNTLKEKGIEVSADEKFNTLIPKIADISGGGGDGLLNITAHAEAVHITKRTVSGVFTNSFYPVINATVTADKEV